MPPISTVMHFGKKFMESYDKVDIPNFIIGIILPSTLNDDQLEELHNVDEDGNIDVREFYEKFDFKTMSLKDSSIVLGYYCHLWLDEYYKFNASKLKIHNKQNYLQHFLHNPRQSGKTPTHHLHTDNLRLNTTSL